MKIDLKAICNTEGKKVEVENSKGQWVKVVEYPVSKVRKLFTLMIKTIESEEKLDEIQQFLNKNSKKYAETFKEIRKKRK